MVPNGVSMFRVPVLHISSGCHQSGLCLKSRLWTIRGHDLATLVATVAICCPHLEFCPVCLFQAL